MTGRLINKIINRRYWQGLGPSSLQVWRSSGSVVKDEKEPGDAVRRRSSYSDGLRRSERLGRHQGGCSNRVTNRSSGEQCRRCASQCIFRHHAGRFRFDVHRKRQVSLKCLSGGGEEYDRQKD